MRQIWLLVSVLLLGLTWAVAQDTTQGSTSPSRGTNPMNSGQNSQASSGEKSVTGCLSGSNGSYTLTDKHGRSYQLTGDTAKLSEHVGHEVRVTGTAGSEGSSATSPTAGGTTAGSEQSLQVTSVKHISKTCSTGTGGTGGMTH